MKWKKYFKLNKEHLLHDTNVNLPEFKTMLNITKQCISNKQYEKFKSEFLILENINTKQLPITKFTTNKVNKKK